jgi:hypothetical protein
VTSGSETIEFVIILLDPKNVTLNLNCRALKRRTVEHSIEAHLVTEIYNAENHSWQKPRRKTTIELVKTREEEEPFIYEMGIPVALAEWTVPCHANILQRVPMNPNRDALASGYAKRIHAACLPTLLRELSAEAVTADWAGAAGVDAAPEIQKEIVTNAFGDNAVRSVPRDGQARLRRRCRAHWQKHCQNRSNAGRLPGDGQGPSADRKGDGHQAGGGGHKGDCRQPFHGCRHQGEI